MKRKSFKQVASLVLAFLVVYTTIAWNGLVVEAAETVPEGYKEYWSTECDDQTDLGTYYMSGTRIDKALSEDYDEYRIEMRWLFDLTTTENQELYELDVAGTKKARDVRMHLGNTTDLQIFAYYTRLKNFSTTTSEDITVQAVIKRVSTGTQDESGNDLYSWTAEFLGDETPSASYTKLTGTTTSEPTLTMSVGAAYINLDYIRIYVPAPKEAAVGEDMYESLEGEAGALANAAEGATIKLLQDVAATESIFLTNGVTLDLAGKTLAMDTNYLGAFAGTNIIDSVGGGLLKVAEGNLILPADNAHMPVYDNINAGYRLTDVDVAAKNAELTAASIYFMTRPDFGSEDIHALVANGAAACAAKVGVRLEWQGQDDGPSYVQDCFFTDAYLKEMYTNSKGATFKVSGVDKVVGFTATPIVLSDSGVKAVGTSYSPATE